MRDMAELLNRDAATPAVKDATAEGRVMLVSDKKTDLQVLGGKPTYGVKVTGRDGVSRTVPDADGKPMRWNPDHARAFDKNTAPPQSDAGLGDEVLDGGFGDSGQLTSDVDVVDSTIESVKDGVDSFSNAYERGALRNQLGHLGFEYRKNRSTETLKAIKKIKVRIDKLGQDGDGILGWIGRVAETIGQKVESLSSQDARIRFAGGAIIGATIGAAGGPLAPVTSSVGAIAGMAAGLKAHAAVDAYEVAVGTFFIEQIEAGVDPDVASLTSLGVGVVGAGVDLAITFGGKEVLDTAKKYMTKKIITEAMKNPKVIKAITERGLDIAFDAGSDAFSKRMDKGINIMGEETGKALRDVDLKSLNQKEVRDLLSTAAEKTFKLMYPEKEKSDDKARKTVRRRRRRVKKNPSATDQAAAKTKGSKPPEKANPKADDLTTTKANSATRRRKRKATR